MSLDSADQTPADPAGEVFSSRFKVWQWLKAQGRWKVAERTLYKHAGEGRLRAGSDGKYSLAAVRRYAKNHLVEVASGLKAGDKLEGLQEIKTQEEIDLKREQRKKLERLREIDEGKYFLTSDLEMEVAARAAVLLTGLRYAITTRAGEWLTLVDGDPARREALAETIWENLSDRLNEYANTTEFQVVVEKGEGDDAKTDV